MVGESMRIRWRAYVFLEEDVAILGTVHERKGLEAANLKRSH